MGPSVHTKIQGNSRIHGKRPKIKGCDPILIPFTYQKTSMFHHFSWLSHHILRSEVHHPTTAAVRFLAMLQLKKNKIVTHVSEGPALNCLTYDILKTYQNCRFIRTIYIYIIYIYNIYIYI